MGRRSHPQCGYECLAIVPDRPVMTLQAGGDVKFQPRVIEGIEFEGAAPVPERLILDGQQRLTSLYQALMLPSAIATRHENNKQVDRWYYVNIEKALGGKRLNGHSEKR